VLAPAAEYATQVLADIGPWMDWLKEKIVAGINIIIGAWTMFEVVLGNLSGVWDIAVAYAEMSLIAIKENVMHVLTVAIPEYAKWFGTNFINLMKDAFNGVITIVSNAVTKLGRMIGEAFAFIASGGAGGISELMANLGRVASGSMLEGFQSSLTELPEIVVRTITEREKELAEKIGDIGGRLGQEFADKMAERMVEAGDELTEQQEAAATSISLQGRPVGMGAGNQATEGRLLTRGPGTRIPDLLQRINDTLGEIRDNTKPRRPMVPNI
jgi:hypothetical protein